MLQIRKIKPEDIGFIIDINSKYGLPGSKVLSNIEHFLICEDGNIKCGCGCLVPYEGKGYISCVIVDEGHRRKKLGSAITKALLNIADLQGIEEVYASGICEPFLQALGFEKCSDKPECYRVFLKGYFKPCPHE